MSKDLELNAELCEMVDGEWKVKFRYHIAESVHDTIAMLNHGMRPDWKVRRRDYTKPSGSA